MGRNIGGFVSGRTVSGVQQPMEVSTSEASLLYF